MNPVPVAGFRYNVVMLALMVSLAPAISLVGTQVKTWCFRSPETSTDDHEFIQALKPMKLRLMFFALSLTSISLPVAAEVYIYRGPNGEKLFSDRPVHRDENHYRLVRRQDTLSDAAAALTRAPVSTGGSAPFRRYIREASQKHKPGKISKKDTVLNLDAIEKFRNKV